MPNPPSWQLAPCPPSQCRPRASLIWPWHFRTCNCCNTSPTLINMHYALFFWTYRSTTPSSASSSTWRHSEVASTKTDARAKPKISLQSVQKHHHLPLQRPSTISTASSQVVEIDVDEKGRLIIKEAPEPPPPSPPTRHAEPEPPHLPPPRLPPKLPPPPPPSNLPSPPPPSRPSMHKPSQTLKLSKRKSNIRKSKP